MDSNWPICELRDEMGYTVLHHAVLVSIDGKVEEIIRIAKQKDGLTSQDIEKWVNAITYCHEWTALHFCSFSGHLNSAYSLIEHRADVFAINKAGLNMLHVAAQGDAGATLYLFWLIGLDINQTDNRGSTPLIWACYSESETAVDYILNFAGPDLNIQDVDGNAAIHFAVKTAENMESTRCIRALLMYGAEYNVQNKKGHLPKDLTAEYYDESNASRISKMFDGADKLKLKFIKSEFENITQEAHRRNSVLETNGPALRLVKINKSKRTLREVKRNYTTM